MYFSFSIVTPANTAATDKKETLLPLRPGVIHRVRIRVPPGHKGLAHLHINHMLKQLYPLNTGEDVHGDDDLVDFKDFYEIYPGFEEFKAFTWNEDDTYEHEFIIGIGILPKWVLIPWKILEKAKEAWNNLVGKWFEV